MSQLVLFIEKYNSIINSLVWGPVLIILLISTGLYLSVKTHFFHITRFSYILKNTLFTIFDKKENKKTTISPFQALTTALAGTVGTGNIVGTATAIAVGGPGALFWIVFSSFFGMMTKYAEIFLSISYRKTRTNGTHYGGPMYYIQDGLGLRWMAILFAFFGFFASFGIGNIAQINSIAISLNSCLGIKPIISGIVIAFFVALVILKDAKRIASTTEKLVPVMTCFYIIVAIIVLISNWQNIMTSIILIISCAFNETAAIGGFVGSSIILTAKKGIANGIFSNEAGLGSSPIAHAMANTKNPILQAFWGIFEVFFVTVIVCSLTGLIIISSGVWSSGLLGADLTILAFSTGVGGFAPYAISLAILFFAFSTLISWSYYGMQCLEFMLGSDKYNLYYKLVFICVIIIGSVSSLRLAWDISDTLNGLMALPNLIAILSLSKIVIKNTNTYFYD